jgi:hypothetical protein
MPEIKVTVKNKKTNAHLKSQINFSKREKNKIPPKILWLIILVIFLIILFFWLKNLLRVELRSVKREDSFFKSLFQNFSEVKKSSQETVEKLQEVFQRRKNLSPQEVQKMKEKIIDIINK